MKLTRFLKRGIKRSAAGTAPPVGTVVAFAGTVAPGGWLLCNGQSTSAYAALAALVGATVPDMRGWAPIGVGLGAAGGATSGTGVVTGGSSLTTVVSGTTYGSETVTLSAVQSPITAHNHSVSQTSHGHGVSDSHTHEYGMGGVNLFNGSNVSLALPGGGNSYDSSFISSGSVAWSNSSVSSGITITDHAGAAATTSHSNTQPSLVVSYIIKT